MRTPAALFSISIVRCGGEPVPGDAKVIVSGYALASAISRCKVDAATFGLTTSV
jgi:hypothetical protein